METDGVDVLYPKEGELRGEGFGLFDSDISDDEIVVERSFIEQTILNCNAIIFCNYDNHLGSTSSMEFIMFNKLNSNFKDSNSCFPIYLLEDINIDELSQLNQRLVKQNMKNGILKVGINQFYNDFLKKENSLKR